MNPRPRKIWTISSATALVIFFNGAEICVAAFRVIYDIGKDMLKSINNMLCAMESHTMRNSERRAPRTHSNLTNIKW